jgi:uncharacterized protein (TIGR03066 family)
MEDAMRLMGVLILACIPLVPLSLTGCSKKDGADGAKAGDGKPGTPPGKEATNAQKIIGKWEATKGEMQPGTVVEFMAGGKMKVTMKAGDKEMAMEGSYEVLGDKLKTMQKAGPKEMSDTDTIKTLNDTTLILEDSKGRINEMKKK